MTELSLSVVVCCYTARRWSRLVAAVGSLLTQDPAPAEILVVVDHCESLTSLARQAFGPTVRVMDSTGAPGLSGARNTGVAAARGDIVAFLDDDAVAEPGWLAALLDGYGDHRVLGVGGHVEPDWQGGRPRWFPREFDWVVGCSHPGMRAGQVRNLIGANMSFRRTTLESVGGFRGDLGRIGTKPVGCEETELCIRVAAQRPGSVLLYRPDAAVRHHVGSERSTVGYFRARCAAEGRSKAAVAELTGAGSALSAERDYVRRVLPRGLAAAARSVFIERDPSGVPRAVALVGGLAATGAGYLAGRLRQRRTDAVAVLILLAALGLWAWSLRALTPDALAGMTDLGLVSVLPPGYWVALAVLVTGCATVIHIRSAPEWLPAAYLAAVIIVLRGTPALTYGSPRYSWSWKHVGIVDYVTRHEAVDPKIGSLTAYHDWPGFFAGNAVLTEAGGLPSALPLATWGPPVFALLVIIPLRLLFGTLVADRRQIWLGLLVFTLANWIGQDYFAPQSFAFLLYLIVLAVCLRWLPARAEPTPGRRALLTVVVLLMLAIVSSHQLTPFMLLFALVLLVAARRVGPWWLPVLLGVLTITWIALMANGFLRQNLYWIVESFGSPAANAQTPFVDLDKVGTEQRVVNYTDRALTGGVLLLAAMGWLRSRRNRTVPALLVIAPLPLLAANDYGGEMLFRVYLFALPCLAVLAAVGFASRVWLSVALAVTLAAAGCLAYYGKERMNYFTPDEVRASRWLYANAPPGSMVIAATATLPWAFEHYETYTYEFMENLPGPDRAIIPQRPAEVVRELVGRHQGPAFVVLTRAQDVAVRYTGMLPANSVPALRAGLAGAPGFRVVYQNSDATVVELPLGGVG